MRLPRTRAEALGAVEAEMAAERAAALGRVTMALSQAVRSWHRLHQDPRASTQDRDAATDHVSRAAWHVLVQRESLGMPGDHMAWMQREHDVPRQALARLGTRRVLVDPPVEPHERVDGIPSLRDHPLWSR